MTNNSETPSSATISQISEILKKLGLTKKEAEVYLYLASNHGYSSGRDISNRLKLHKGETYRILQSLQSRGIVEATMDRPMIYIGVPIEKILDLHIETMKGQVSYLESEKKKMISQFKSINFDIPSLNKGKFIILKGHDICKK